ncbi:MAG: phosphatidylserine decarboxylase [Desulfobulbaceae bacterium]|nr:phosphatidylserine decarboxylase [Desulfobulbaceae bacterium]
MAHQYIARETGAIISEKLIADRTIALLYNRLREHAPSLFQALTSKRMSGWLGFLHFDLNLPLCHDQGLALLKRMGVDWRECLAPHHSFTSARQVFERQIRYWDCRPMDPDPQAIAAPADAKVLIGTLEETPELFIKEKFFSTMELLGDSPWHTSFAGGDFAIFRLTPDKYHFNHIPVSGEVVDIYELEGGYHSCNPQALIALASLHAKNRRVVTIIDTDVIGGSGIGLVAMIEVVALMIGDIVQCYSDTKYDHPVPVVKGMRLTKGCPKSLYRPGSSTDILLFEKDSIVFSEDLRKNVVRRDVQSRFSSGLGRPLVETDVKVRSTIAIKRPGLAAGSLQPAPTIPQAFRRMMP